MHEASVPSYVHDATRLDVLDRYEVLDTPSEDGFDDVVQLATILCDAPVSLVSLVSHDRQWFKARIGFSPCQTDLQSSVCAFALVEPDLLVIPDLTKDARTSHNPLVTGDPHIRFYAGAPLRTAAGDVLGSLCVIDTKTRPDGLSPNQATGLRNLARQIICLLELRRALSQKADLVRQLSEASDRRHALLAVGDILRDANSISEMTRDVAEVVGKTLDASRAGFARFDAKGENVIVEADWSADGVSSISGPHRVADFGTLLDNMIATGAPVIIENIDQIAGDLDPEPLRKLGIRSMVNMAVRDHGRTAALLFVHFDRPQILSGETITLLRNVADRLESSTARFDAEERQRILNLELSHRMKNTFAMVQALATQTLRNVTEREPIAAFTQRIHALSTAHDVLLQQSWTAAQMREVVISVLGALEKIDRFAVEGPNIKIGPRATLSLSLLLHELSTNALKYGSLSAPAGSVHVRWFVRSLGVSDELVLIWTECGGPEISQQSSTGFGTKLIKMGLVGTGGTDVSYAPSGLVATFTAPLDEVQKS